MSQTAPWLKDSALRPVWSTMASADFSIRIPRPCSLGSLIVRRVWRSPRVRRNPFPRSPPDIPMSHPSGYRASLSIARLPCDHRPSIRFLFVGSEFCLRLPPDLASRQRPCLQLTVPTTTACSGLAPAGILRPRGAPIFGGWPFSMNSWLSF